MPDTVRKGYQTLIHQLANLEGQPGEIRVLELTPEALKAWEAWHDAHCTEMESQELQPGLKGHYNVRARVTFTTV